MCTIGAISAEDAEGAPVVFALKTNDNMPKPVWHACITGGEGHDLLGFNLLERPGVNSGMNNAGLAVVRSFLDFRGPFTESEDPKPAEDIRTDVDHRSAIGAYVLERFSCVEEALPHVLDLIPHYTGKDSGQRGGNFFMADANGNIAVVEHCEDRIAHHFYTEGFTARGNNGLLILQEEQAALPEYVRLDRETRCQKMSETVQEIRDGLPRGMRKEEALKKLKEVLTWRGIDGDGGLGSICCEALRAPGVRTNSAEPCSTSTAVIFDLVEKVMHYTRGNPAKAPWRTLGFSD